jgi:hypothetical protein
MSVTVQILPTEQAVSAAWQKHVDMCTELRRAPKLARDTQFMRRFSETETVWRDGFQAWAQKS